MSIVDVLAAGGQDLLADQPVARVGTHRARAQVPVLQGRQDADHHQVGADLRGLGLGVVEAAPQVRLERRQPALAQLGRRHVDLDVELAQLGLEVRVGDGGQRLGVLQRRVTELVDEVELHLEPGHRVVGVELVLAQHPGERVEAAVHLLAVAGAVGAGELLCFDVFAHGRDPRADEPAAAVARPGAGQAARPALIAGATRPAAAPARAPRRPRRPGCTTGRPRRPARARTRRARRRPPARQEGQHRRDRRQQVGRRGPDQRRPQRQPPVGPARGRPRRAPRRSPRGSRSATSSRAAVAGSGGPTPAAHRSTVARTQARSGGASGSSPRAAAATAADAVGSAATLAASSSREDRVTRPAATDCAVNEVAGHVVRRAGHSGRRRRAARRTSSGRRCAARRRPRRRAA